MLVLCQFTRTEMSRYGFASNPTMIPVTVRDSTMLKVDRPSEILPAFETFARKTGHRNVQLTRYTPENFQPTW